MRRPSLPHPASAFAAACLASAVLAAPLAAQTVTPIRQNGSSANRVDLVILGDGFTAAEIASGAYAAAAETAVQGLFAQEPFREYQNYFNVARVDVASAESGSDHPHLGVYKNTAFGSWYDCNGIQRLICYDYSAVFTTVNTAIPAANARDFVILLVNDTEYGGSGGTISVASLHAATVELVLHEFGHSFGLLADEYAGGQGVPCTITTEPSQVNVTLETRRAYVKWGAWIDPSTPLPTTTTTAGIPGLYLGGAYCDTGVYRPTYNSKMRSLSVPFEQINAEQLVRRIHNWVSPLDGASPSATSLTLSAPTTFSVTTPQPRTHGLEVAWTLDGAGVCTGLTCQIAPAQLAGTSAHQLRATITDRTTLVRNDPSGLLTETRDWTLQAAGYLNVTAHPAGQTAAVGQTVSFSASVSASPAATVQWQVSSNAGVSWSAVAGATSTTLSVTVASALHGNHYRAVFTNTVGSAATNGALLIVAGQITGSPRPLRFAATKAGPAGALAAVTPPQTVVVAPPSPSTSWTASTTQGWLQVTGGSGTGAGSFTVSVVNPGNVIAGATSLTGAVTITPAGAGLAPFPLQVVLTVDQTGGAATAAPFGLVDTPAQNATGLQGTVGVTGWVVDDVGVAGVKLYRNCLAFEPPVNCATVAGRTGMVFVGDATLVSGARGDVEALYPTYPLAYRAAWGYLLLTNLLPDIPGASMYGGQGTLALSALATDVEGKQTWLGRSLGDTTATTITLANATIAKPFGALDTPAQGATIGGAFFANFGWALTPDSNTTGGEAGDILVPVNGSTLVLYIDGAPRAGTITFNQCRGTTAGPVGAGTWCDDDVASIFGNPTPQPTLTPRTSNPTRFRNLDIGRGAIGSLLLDTTVLPNGVHTIMWGVTDSAGRGEGLGSRYFTVLNGGGRPAAPEAPAADTRSERRPEGLVGARTGLDLDAPYVVLEPDRDGIRHLQVSDLGRLDVTLGEAEAGWAAVNGERRALPAGSQLDAARGTFTWAPGVGFHGTYRLQFERAADLVTLDVTVRPAVAAPAGAPEVAMSLDAPGRGATVSGTWTVAGWALDPHADVGAGIDAVHVWAQRADVAAAEPVFLGAATLGGMRQDLAAAYGSQFERAAFSLTVPARALPAGLYDVTAYVWNRRTARWEDARGARIAVR